MDNHATVLPPVPVHPDFHLHSSGPDSYESLLTGHNSSYSNERNHSLPTNISPFVPQSNGIIGRMSSRPHDHSFYPPTSHQSDSAAPTIVASPASHQNSLSISNYPLTNYSNSSSLLGQQSNYPSTTQAYSGPAFGFDPMPPGPLHGLPNPRHSRLALNTTASGLAANGRLHILGSTPTSPSSGSAVRENYSTSTPGLRRHLHGRHTMDISRSSYTNVVSESPRLILSSHGGLPSVFDPASTMYAPHQTYTPSPQISAEGVSPPFQEDRSFHVIQDSLGNVVTPIINAKIEKGFFLSGDSSWTCYRRNYFSVNVSYSFKPWPASSGQLYLRKDKSDQAALQIQAMALCLSATVDGSNGKAIELVQHTPKRDKGPQTIVQITKLSPMPPPVQSGHRGSEHSYQLAYPLSGHHRQSHHHHIMLPLQNVGHEACSSSDASNGNTTSPNAVAHTFERIQFKSATANNGKRRAQQQYYHLIVELYVDVRTDHGQKAKWIKASQIASDPVVVRGRSPSHYQNEGPNSSARSHPPIIGNSRAHSAQDWSQISQSSGHTGHNHLARYSSQNGNGQHYGQVHNVGQYVPMHNDISESMRQPYVSNGSAGTEPSMVTSQAEESKPTGYSYHPQALPYGMGMSRGDDSDLPTHTVTMSSGRAPNDNAIGTSRGVYHYSNGEQMRGIITDP